MLIITDLKQILKHGIVRHFKYLFNYSRTGVYMQMDLSRLLVLPDISPLEVRELNQNDDIALKAWANLINQSYKEEHYDIEAAKKIFSNHLYLNIKKIFLIYDNDFLVGTISSGVYKSNPKMGGAMRFAVHPNFQGKGLGKYLFILVLHSLREDGIKFFETITSVKRKESLIIKMKMGFFPQFNRKYVQFKKQKRFFLIRLIANYHLYKLWRKHKNKLYKEFIPKNPI